MLFSRCREYYEDETEAERRRLSRLNNSILKLDSEDTEVREQLESLAREITRNIGELTAVRENLVELKDAFFSEMKRIGDQVGNPMPAPSAIDMIDDAPDARRIVLDYKKSKGLKPGLYAEALMRERFAGIEPVIALLPGGSRYAERLANVIRRNCSPTACVRVNSDAGGRKKSRARREQNDR
jgi:hypothetical protein